MSRPSYSHRDVILDWDLRATGLIRLDEIWSPTGVQFRNKTTQPLGHKSMFAFAITFPNQVSVDRCKWNPLAMEDREAT